MPLRDPACAKVHAQIEEAFAHRFAGALSPQFRSSHGRLPVGFDQLDALLQGGFPIGGMSELVGPASSGRTTVAVSLLAHLMQKECTAAWVDADDTFDPLSAATNGVDLQRLLWVRCRKRATSATTQAVPPAVVHTQVSAAQQIPKRGGSPHPRSEGHGMEDAIAAMLSKYPSASAIPDRRARCVIGTPSAPNRPVMPFPTSSPYREEQVGTDRVTSRRENVFQQTEELVRQKSHGSLQTNPEYLSVNAATLCSGQHKASSFAAEPLRKERWDALSKAIRAADLLLHAGGFTLVVLDLGNVAPEMALNIPLSTWFRFRSACARTQTTMVLITQQACAKTSADMLVRFGPASLSRGGGRVLTELSFETIVERVRSTNTSLNTATQTKKQPRSDFACKWSAQTAWAQSR